MAKISKLLAYNHKNSCRNIPNVATLFSWAIADHMQCKDSDNLCQRRGALAEARKNELIALRTYVDNMLSCGAILADAIEQMWDVGADRSEIVEALRLAANITESHGDGEAGKPD
jgi:hypothetical protein